jgi:hypothetical protein
MAFASEKTIELRTQAKDRNASAETLKGFLKSKDAILLMGLGANPSAPVEVLAKLAAHKDGGVRWAVARNASAPTALLETLTTDEHTFTATYARKALANRFFA